MGCKRHDYCWHCVPTNADMSMWGWDPQPTHPFWQPNLLSVPSMVLHEIRCGRAGWRNEQGPSVCNFSGVSRQLGRHKRRPVISEWLSSVSSTIACAVFLRQDIKVYFCFYSLSLWPILTLQNAFSHTHFSNKHFQINIGIVIQLVSSSSWWRQGPGILLIDEPFLKELTRPSDTACFRKCTPVEKQHLYCC